MTAFARDYLMKARWNVGAVFLKFGWLKRLSTRKMELGLGFPHKSYIYYKPGERLSLRKVSITVQFPPVLSSASRREKLRIAARGGCLRSQSFGFLPLNLKNRDTFTAAYARSVGLSADANVEEDEIECDVTEQEDVTEYRLSGDETELSEVNYSFFSIRTAKKIIFKVRDVSRQFVMNNIAGVVGLLTMFQQQPEPKVLQLRTAMIEEGNGAIAVQKWSATELTMQHGQLARIAMDMNYLVFAFAFFGLVRILEATVAVFSTNPPVLRRMLQSFYAVDYLTIAWLAHNLRKPFLNILRVDPTDLQRVSVLKAQMWEELHAFFERQWKVMATVAAANFIVVVANHIPPSQWVTANVKVLCDILITLPVF